MADQSKTKVYADEVQCVAAPDGGALVTARFEFSTVFQKAFSCEQTARDCAAELFLNTQEVERNCPTP